MALSDIGLQQAFDSEIDRIASSVGGCATVAGVFRLRALLEISDALSTTALLQLASIVAPEAVEGPPDALARDNALTARFKTGLRLAVGEA